MGAHAVVSHAPVQFSPQLASAAVLIAALYGATLYPWRGAGVWALQGMPGKQAHTPVLPLQHTVLISAGAHFFPWKVGLLLGMQHCWGLVGKRGVQGGGYATGAVAFWGGDITGHQLKTLPRLAEGMLVLCVFVCAPGSDRLPFTTGPAACVGAVAAGSVCCVVCLGWIGRSLPERHGLVHTPLFWGAR